MAQEQYNTVCKVLADSNQFGTDADAQTWLQGLNGDQTNAAASSPVRVAIKDGETTKDASTSASWDTSGYYGGGSCPSGVIGSGMFAINIPMTDVCTGVTWLGRVLVGLTAVACFLIYSRILGGM